LDDFVAGRASEAGDEAGAASVMVGMAPVGMMAGSLGRTGASILKTGSASTPRVVHTSLLNGRGMDVQRRILIR
jgi:hypothetical protein